MYIIGADYFCQFLGDKFIWAFPMAIDLVCHRAQIGSSNTLRDAGHLPTVTLNINLDWRHRSRTVIDKPKVCRIFAPLHLLIAVGHGADGISTAREIEFRHIFTFQSVFNSSCGRAYG